VYFCLLSTVWTQGCGRECVSLSAGCSVNVQGVSLSTTSSVDVHGCIPFPSLLHGHAVCIHLHYHQCGCAGVSLSFTTERTFRVYPSPLPAVLTCRVYPSPPSYNVFKCCNSGLYQGTSSSQSGTGMNKYANAEGSPVPDQGKSEVFRLPPLLLNMNGSHFFYTIRI
jgi:hypothetical protein